jgi:hypothetical protein
MFNRLSITLTGAMLIFTVSAVNAHSPEMHKKENAEKPNCQAMANMDHSKMDMNDPIMMAMMQQCMGNGAHNDGHNNGHNGEHKDMNNGHGDMHKNTDGQHNNMKHTQ